MRIYSPPTRIRPAVVEDLKAESLFAGVTDEIIETLVPHSHICKLERKKKLFPERPDGKYLYVIRNGYFALRVNSDVLRWDNFLAWRGPGQILGEFALLFSEFEKGILHETEDYKLLGLIGELKATGDCELLEIEGATFVRAANADPNIYRNVSCLLIKKMIQEDKRSEVIQLSPALKQVAKTLLLLIQERGYRPGTKKIIRGRILQLDIAGYIGVSREHVNIQLKNLKEAGIISYGEVDGKIAILDEDKLSDVVEMP